MISFVFAFLLGDLFLLCFTKLPSMSMACIIALLALIFSRHRMMLGFIGGFLWTLWCAQQLLSWQLPKEIENKPTQITGYIASIPITENLQTKFLFQLPNHQLIRLSWQNPKEIHSGEEWRLHVKLKRIHGLSNPGGFDFEAWALQKHIRATGYVIGKGNNQLIKSTHAFPLEQMRERIKLKIQTILPTSQISHWLLALMLGERNNIPQEHWQTLRKTGTNHLMAIAGLHIGILTTLVFLIMKRVWHFAHLNLMLPMLEAAKCMALLFAWIYSALAGFSIPTQRACIMLSIYVCFALTRRKMSAWQVFSLALLIILLINPLNILSISFWLSFITIAIIIYGLDGRLSPRGLWWKWGRVQWVIAIGLIPLSLYLYQEFSVIAFVANAIAIPWLACLILPFCFLSLIFLFIYTPLAQLFLFIADKSLLLLWKILTFLSTINLIPHGFIIPNFNIFILMLFATLLLIAPKHFPGRYFSIFFLLPIIFYQPMKPKLGEMWLSILDVGQGLSVVVQTQSHALVYDAGAHYPNGLDMGESVVLPFIKKQGVNQLDMLVISHADNDHSGGANALIQNIRTRRISASAPEKLPSHLPVETCLAGQEWIWDGVKFAFLYPDKDSLALGNNSSCVLKIDNGFHSFLLTGDIEKKGEKKLLLLADKLKSSILIVPHHGSKTSSTQNFISAVNPEYAVFAVGYLNRYHLPHPVILQRYQIEKRNNMLTSETGAIQFQIKKKIEIARYRLNHHYFWNDVCVP